MERLLRLVGAAVTVLAALWYSAAENRETRERIVKCKRLLCFLCECKTQVELHSLPLGGILARCTLQLPNGFIECAGRKGFAVAVNEWKYDLLGGEEERLLLTEFAEGFGKGSAVGEVKRCAEFIERLEKHTQTLENGAKTECKTRLAVSLCVSLMAVLFFA